MKDCKLARILSDFERGILVREAFIKRIYVSEVKQIGVVSRNYNGCSNCDYSYCFNRIKYCFEHNVVLDFLDARFEVGK